MIGYTHVANETRHISGSQIDHVYIKSAVLEEFHIKAIVQNIYFSDHDAVRIIFITLVNKNWCQMLLDKY